MSKSATLAVHLALIAISIPVAAAQALFAPRWLKSAAAGGKTAGEDAIDIPHPD